MIGLNESLVLSIIGQRLFSSSFRSVDVAEWFRPEISDIATPTKTVLHVNRLRRKGK